MRTRQNCRFEFICPLKWDELKVVDDKTRYCSECKSNVHWVDNSEEFYMHALERKCVAMADTRVSPPDEDDDNVGPRRLMGVPVLDPPET